MFDEYSIISKVLAAVMAGYFLGSVPFAHIAGRLNGVDIFATGNQRAGTANVFWNIGRRVGLLVFALDVAKGALAITVAQLLDAPAPVVLVAGGAAVVGHWKSMFTGFRGGDGMATLVGITLTLVPPLALLGFAIGMTTILLFRRSPFRSVLGIASCILVLLGLSQYYQVDQNAVLGVAIMSVLVIFHNIIVRRRRAHFQDGDEPSLDLGLDLGLELELDMDIDLDQDATDLGAPAPENN